MVSKASEDLPEPESPVMTVRRSRGISTLMSFRLCWRAPRTVMRSIAIAYKTSARATGENPEPCGNDDCKPRARRRTRRDAVVRGESPRKPREAHRRDDTRGRPALALRARGRARRLCGRLRPRL